MSGSGLSHQKSTSRSSVFSSNSKPNDEDSGALHESLAGLSKSIDDLSILRLKGALEGVIDVIKAAKAGKNKQTDVEDLRSHIERLESSIIRPLKEARMTMSLQTRLEILTNDLEQIRVDYQKRSGKGRFGKFLTIGDKSMTLGNVGSMINKASQSFLSDSHLHVPVAAKEFVFTQAEKALLNRLPNADARFNSAARKAAPSCLENTRVALLKEVFAWIDSSDNKEKIYWLHGLAGTGKSTVANTVASRLAQQDRLGASFFFSRDVEERRDPLRVLPSIARQFAEFSPEYKGHLVKSLDGRKDAGKSALPIQMERLFVIPLRSMGAQQTPLIVVMDALDECDNNQLVTTLLRLLSEFILTNPEINLKIFITSRPEPHIEAAFRRGSANQVSKPFVLHDIERSIVQADIKVYLRYELEKVARAYKISKQWPSNRELNELVERAGGLFIAASTSIKFIADPRERQPERRLQALLSEKRAPGQAPYKDLDQVYYRVLGAVVQGRKDPNDELCVRFRDVVGTIITVLDPLPPRALQHLLGCNIDVITSTVVPLRSVIIVPSNAESDTDQLRVFHLSFPNFLTERCTDPRFIIDSMLRHHRLALSCITLLSSFLKRNVCQLPDSLKLNSEVPDLEERLKNVVPMHYQYASRHWGFHLRAISEAVNAPKPRDAATQQVLDRITDSLQQAVSTFCEKNLLQWLEVLSLLGSLDLAIPQLKAVEVWLKKYQSSSPTLEILRDAQRLLLRFFEPVHMCAAQIYHTALAFMPHSRLLKTYESELDGSVKFVVGREPTWNPCMRVLDGHGGWANCATYSNDNSRIVSGSADKNVRIWDATTGTLIKILEGHTGAVTCTVFSHDDARIASASWDRTICIWDSETGTRIRALKGHSDPVRAVVFSHDSSLIISGSADKTIGIWDSITGTLIHSLRGHYDSVSSVAISHDDSQIVSGSDDRTIRVWDAVNKSLIRVLKLYKVHETEVGHKDAIRSVALSRDSKFVVSASDDKTACVWDVSTGEVVCTWDGHHSAVRTASFSHDGSKVVSGSSDRTLCIWGSKSGTLIRRLEGHTNAITSVEFSKDDSNIISGSGDKTVSIWEVTGAHFDPFRGHRETIMSLEFSKDHTRIVTGSGDKTICVWDTSNGALLRKIEASEPINSVSISPNNQHLISRAGEKTLNLWDAVTGSLIYNLTGHTRYIACITFSNGGRWASSGSWDGTACLWDIASGTLFRALKGHPDSVRSITFSHDDLMVATGSDDLGLRLWDAPTGSLIRTIKGSGGPVRCVSFSPDDLYILTAGDEKRVYFWDVETGDKLKTLEGHLEHIWNIGFTRNGSTLLSWDMMGRCHSWLSETGDPEDAGTNDENPTQHHLSVEDYWIVLKSVGGAVEKLCYLPISFSNTQLVIVSQQFVAVGTHRGVMLVLDMSQLLEKFGPNVFV